MSDRPEVRGDPLATLSARKGAMWRTYPVVDARVLFVQVNKNACTSVKWLMAQLAGEDLDGFGPSMAASTSADDDIHDRRQWRRTPRLDQLDPAVRSEIHPDNGWFVFAITRDPRARLFSAWQSKLLLDNPGYSGFRSSPWYPCHPVSEESVVEDFAAFVDVLSREPAPGIRGDGHFCDQVELLHEDVVTYTHIYDVNDLGSMQADLRAHLARVGWTGPLTLPRLNDTPLRVNARPFADGVDTQVEKIYAADFARFGDRWDFATIERAPAWTVDELAEVDRRASVGRRLGYLRDQARTARSEVATQRQRIKRQRAQIVSLRGRLRDERARRPRPQVRPRSPLTARLRRLVGRALRWLRRS